VSGATTSSLNVTADPAHSNDLYVCNIVSKAGDMVTGGDISYFSPPAQVTASVAVPTLNPAALALLALTLAGLAGVARQRLRR
jgi:hypothetical protein